MLSMLSSGGYPRGIVYARLNRITHSPPRTHGAREDVPTARPRHPSRSGWAPTAAS